MQAKLKLKRKSEDIITSSAWGPHVIKHPRPQQWTKGTGKTDLTILINGKPLSIPMLAANAVFPLQARKKIDAVKSHSLCWNRKIVKTWSDNMMTSTPSERPFTSPKCATCI